MALLGDDELPLSESDRERIVQLYQEYVPVTEIAEDFGVTRQTVHDVIKRAGVETHAETAGNAAYRVLAARQSEFGAAMRDMLRHQGVMEGRMQALERRLELLEQRSPSV